MKQSKKMFGKLPVLFTSEWGLLTILVISTIISGIFVFNLISEPITQPYIYGIKTSYKSISETVEPINNQSEVFIGQRNIMAYSPSSDETYGNPCIGAYGDNLCEMLVNGDHPVATNEFPNATRLLINDIVCIVSDTRPYDNNDIEIFMATKEKAVEWGIKYLDVFKIYE